MKNKNVHLAIECGCLSNVKHIWLGTVTGVCLDLNVGPVLLHSLDGVMTSAPSYLHDLRTPLIRSCEFCLCLNTLTAV